MLRGSSYSVWLAIQYAPAAKLGWSRSHYKQLNKRYNGTSRQPTIFRNSLDDQLANGAKDALKCISWVANAQWANQVLNGNWPAIEPNLKIIYFCTD